MTLKKIFTVWILLTLVFLTVLGTIHAWTSLLADGAGSLATIPPFLSNGFQIEATTYFIAGLVMTSILLGATCYLIFSSEPLDLPLYQLSKDFEAKLEEKSQEIKSSTIGELVIKKIKNLDNVAYIRFASVYRDFQDIKDFKKELKEL